MDLQHANIVLEKITALQKNIGLGEEITSIERDLMLSYIRQLYEAYLLPAYAPAADHVAEAAQASVAKAKPTTPEAPAKKQYTPPRIIEISDSVKDMVAEAAAPPPRPAPAPPAPAPAPAPKVEAPAPAPAAKASVSGKYADLFKIGQAKELSEKLSLQPLADLTKALTINDRLLYANDLFGKDNNAFSQALQALNSQPNMDEASKVLVAFAQQYDWTNDEKADTARDFIKLVRRRYV